MDSEYIPPIRKSHPQPGQPFCIKYTIKNPNFFVIDKISNDYITNHKRKYFIFLIKCDFKIIFNNDFSKSIHIETESYHNTTFLNLKKFLLNHIDDFIEKRQIFSHIDVMNITTVNGEMYMSYKYYIQHPMPMVGRRLNMLIAKNPYLKKSVNRSHIHPLFRKKSHIR